MNRRRVLMLGLLIIVLVLGKRKLRRQQLKHELRRQLKHEYRCSFCGKEQHSVERLIAGPGGVYICNECIVLCNEIIEEGRAGKPKPDDEAVQATEAAPRRKGGFIRAVRGRKMIGPPAEALHTQEGDAAVQALLAPLAAEVTAARARLEELARENGALRERVRVLEAR